MKILDNLRKLCSICHRQQHKKQSMELCHACKLRHDAADLIEQLQAEPSEAAVKASYMEGMEDGRVGWCNESDHATSDEERWYISSARVALESAAQEAAERSE